MFDFWGRSGCWLVGFFELVLLGVVLVGMALVVFGGIGGPEFQELAGDLGHDRGRGGEAFCGDFLAVAEL